MKLSRPSSPEEAAQLRAQARQRIVQIQEELARVDYICAGTLQHRTRVCGKPGCRCAREPAARHGPYYEWGRIEGGHLVHSKLSRQEARRFVQAMRKHRRLKWMLRRWQQESVQAMLAESVEQS
jgi:hypothetical protein